MLTFKHFISNDLILEGANLHIEHIEDGILNSGYKGASSTIKILEGIANMLAGNSEDTVMITTKWDGRPSLFCGYHPENNRFFIGTKSALNKNNPRICYTPEDIDQYYDDVEPLNSRLHAALKYLPELSIKGILQGDILFGPDDIKEQNIKGEDYITFHPNTILYAVPSNSDLGKKIRQAKLGVVFHTAYEGDSLQTLKGSFKISLSGLRKSKNVWYDDATYKDVSGSVTLTGDETDLVNEQLNKAKTILATITNEEFRNLLSHKTYLQLIKQHQNQLIRGGEQINDTRQWVSRLPGFLEQKINKEKTSPDAQKRKLERLSVHTQNIPLEKILNFQKQILEVKSLLMTKLENAKRVGTFHVSDKELKVVKQEGFVAVDHIGNAVKLVDRLEFSKHNWKRRENEEITAVAKVGPLMKQGSFMGGETGLAGKKDATPSYLGKSTGQFTDSTGTL